MQLQRRQATVFLSGFPLQQQGHREIPAAAPLHNKKGATPDKRCTSAYVFHRSKRRRLALGVARLCFAVSEHDRDAFRGEDMVSNKFFQVPAVVQLNLALQPRG